MSPTVVRAPIGVLLAAGRGRRMGRTKQLLPWPTPDGPVPLVAAAFDAIRPMCGDVVVVVGHEAARVQEALAGRATRFVLADADAEMFASVRAGIRAAHAIDPDRAVLVHPADHPMVPATTRAALIAAHAARPDDVIAPVAAGRGGHPVILPAVLADLALAYDGPGGLGGFRATHPAARFDVAVDDPEVTRDLDRPEEYERALGERGRPS